MRELSAELEQRVQERTAELQRREAELARKAALLEQVIRNVNQGISFINSDLVIELCNDKFAELLELPTELCQGESEEVSSLQLQVSSMAGLAAPAARPTDL